MCSCGVRLLTPEQKCSTGGAPVGKCTVHRCCMLVVRQWVQCVFGSATPAEAVGADQGAGLLWRHRRHWLLDSLQLQRSKAMVPSALHPPRTAAGV